ncbi:MAG: alkaline shock response membrane anchor protein AmaP [Promicromonosporaceae bacterium]|nr:alkaline shock response membrane anchor protein AmaP [Promicromonosporaceae bacterium]
MRMKLSDRLLIALYAILGLIALILAAFYAWAPDPLRRAAAAVVEAVSGALYLRILAVLLGVAMLTWTARVFMLAFKHEASRDKESVAIQRTENGAVRVSVAAVDTLVRQAIGRIESMSEVRTKVVNHDDSVTIKIEMALSGDAHIPNVTLLMQKNVKKFVEEYSGIAVREVEIVVFSIRPAEIPPIGIAEASGLSREPRADGESDADGELESI